MKKIAVLIFSFLAFIFLALPIMAYDPLETPNNIYGIGIVNHSDLEDVSNLVNTNGGDWGYATIVVTENERNKEVWQSFFDECRRKHLMPIIRIATNFDSTGASSAYGKNWEIPKIENVDSWVNFLNSLNWVVENRYVIIGNEPNHAKEWGGKINPEEYAIYLKTFSERLKNSSKDYFVLNAGFDQDAPNSKNTMDQQRFIQRMQKEIPDIFEFIDGWNTHSYPNPAFSGSKTATGRRSIRGYEWELNLVKKDLPVFITETGWTAQKIKDQGLMANNMKYAYEEVWGKDKRIVAVTPFILNYPDEPFYGFSWKNKDNTFFPIYNEIQNIKKEKGQPIQKISGEIIFNFLSPLMFGSTEQKGLVFARNTGQAIWTNINTNIKSENEEIEIKDIKIQDIEPFSTGLVVYTLKTKENKNVHIVKIGFYVLENRLGDVFNGKIISF